jgi:hypothetical protein
VKEGGLLARWVTELRTASAKARAELQNLVIDLTILTAISQQGNGMLLGLMSCYFQLRIWTAAK